MNKILNFLQDASDLYITFTESQICLDLRNKSIIKLESIINSTSPESKDVLYEMLYSWAKDASFTPLYGPFSDKMLEDAVSQNTIKENTARKIICSIEEIIFSLNKDDREIFIKRLFKRVLPFFTIIIILILSICFQRMYLKYIPKGGKR